MNPLQAALDQLRLDEICVYRQGQPVKVVNAYLSLGRLIVDIEEGGN